MLEEMKSALEKSVVTKTELLTFRSFDSKTVVFAFEGVDDKIVYHKWITRLRPGLQYEPFPCGSKKKVLELHNSLLRDKGGLAKGVYFFVDRDFDDLQGNEPHDAVFMTDFYSVENYLVNVDVVEEVLKNDFHCHGRPDVRAPIVDCFRKTLSEFLSVAKPVNRRIFVARKAGGIDGSLPSKIREFSEVQLHTVSAVGKTPEELIAYTKEIDQLDLDQLHAEFENFEPLERYRGKYLKEFLEKWLEALANDYSSRESQHFSQLNRRENVKRTEHQLGGLASKSPTPASLADFLARVQSANNDDVAELTIVEGQQEEAQGQESGDLVADYMQIASQ